MFDVGANFGWFGLHSLAAVGMSDCIWAFELQEVPCDEMRVHATLNGFEDTPDNQLLIWKCVVGDTDREVTFAKGSSQSHELLSMYRRAPETDQRTFRVKQLSLDTAAANLPADARPPKFIKCDIEGAELSVLKGVRSLLQAPQKPVLLLEINRSAVSRAGREPEMMVSLLEECGYSDFLFVSHAQRPKILKARRSSSHTRLPDKGNLVALNSSLHQKELAGIPDRM